MFRNLSTFGLPLSGRPSELIELALSFGFDGMDVDLLDLEKQAAIYGVEHARRLMVSARLKSGSFRLPVRLDAPEKEFEAELAELPARLELAAAAECHRAITTLAPVSEEHSFKDFFELHRIRLHTIGDLLAPHGIQLGLAIRPERPAEETTASPFICTFEALLGLVTVAHERIGAVVDAWAMHVTGEPVEMVAKLPKGRIVEVRLSDAPRGTSGSEFTEADRLMPCETGVIPVAEVLKAAEAAGFEGPVTPWAHRSTLAGRGREKIVRLAGERMEQAWKDAGLEILPRWFAPVARDQFGRPIEELAEIVAVAEQVVAERGAG
jgi:sugar phosphate isomerase/epimerase